MEAKEFFDRYWRVKHLRRFDRYYEFLQIANDDLFNRLEKIPLERTLVIGLGDSPDAVRLGGLTAKLIAVDISMDGLMHLRDLPIIQMDGHFLGFRSSTFDMVFLRTVLLHCDHRKLIGELRRVLKKNGIFVWIEPLKHNPLLWLYRSIFSPGKHTESNYLTFAEMEYIRMVFGSIWHREYYLFSVLLLPVFMALPRLRKMVLSLQRIEMKMVDAIPWLRRWCWISCGYAGAGPCW